MGVCATKSLVRGAGGNVRRVGSLSRCLLRHLRAQESSSLPIWTGRSFAIFQSEWAGRRGRGLEGGEAGPLTGSSLTRCS